MMYSYKLHNLNISLPLPCPFLAETDSTPDVVVTYGNVPRELTCAVASDNTWEAGYCWHAAPGRYLLRGGLRSGRFLAEGGNRVIIHRNEYAEDDWLLFHLLHSVYAALLRQRGFLVLHGSTANTPMGAMALCGTSGAGKSTTLAAMLGNRCSMISDDITVLRFGADSTVEVVPGTPRIHLWQDAVEGIGLTMSGSDCHTMRRGKAAMRAPGESCQVPTPIRKLCILELSREQNVNLSRLKGVDKFDALMGCIYGPLFQEEHPNLFDLFSGLVKQADIIRLRRPEDRWTVGEVVEAVLDG